MRRRRGTTSEAAGRVESEGIGVIQKGVYLLLEETVAGREGESFGSGFVLLALSLCKLESANHVAEMLCARIASRPEQAVILYTTTHSLILRDACLASHAIEPC